MTYAKAGVDARHIHETHKLLARRLESTFATRKGKVGWPIFPIGHYAGLVDLGQGRVLSLHTDSVGTKVLIAQMMRKYDTIGIDCVAMCANDLICTGAEPISFLHYMAMTKPDRAVVDEAASGIAKAWQGTCRADKNIRKGGERTNGKSGGPWPRSHNRWRSLLEIGKGDRTGRTWRRTRRAADPARNISTHKTSRTCTGHGNVSD